MMITRRIYTEKEGREKDYICSLCTIIDGWWWRWRQSATRIRIIEKPIRITSSCRWCWRRRWCKWCSGWRRIRHTSFSSGSFVWFAHGTCYKNHSWLITLIASSSLALVYLTSCFMFLPKVTQVLLVLLVVAIKSSLITRRAIKTRRTYPVFLCVFVLCQCCFIFILCLLCLSFIDLFFRGIKRLPAHTGDLCKCRKWQIFILELGSKMVAKHDISRRWLDRCILVWSRMSLIFSLPTSSNVFTGDCIIFSRRHATTLGAWYWTNECMMTHNHWLLRWWSWMVIVVRYIYKARWIYAISSKRDKKEYHELCRVQLYWWQVKIREKRFEHRWWHVEVATVSIQ